jgi:hypothetical protein
MLAASLREVPASGNAELRRKRLQDHRHDVANDDYAQKRIAEF